MWEDAIALFREYAGTGLIVIWYVICLIYLWIREKRKYIRVLLLYAPVLLLLIYFNPLFAGLIYGLVGGEIYYRIASHDGCDSLYKYLHLRAAGGAG